MILSLNNIKFNLIEIIEAITETIAKLISQTGKAKHIY